MQNAESNKYEYSGERFVCVLGNANCFDVEHVLNT